MEGWGGGRIIGCTAVIINHGKKGSSQVTTITYQVPPDDASANRLTANTTVFDKAIIAAPNYCYFINLHYQILKLCKIINVLSK